MDRTENPNLINVLDHGFVRLIESMGNDLSIVRNARVSYNAEWRTGDDEGKDKKLINYLWQHKHTTPFEAVVFTFEIKCPIFVARQWHRHRTWAYNEISARYAQLPQEFYVPNPHHITRQDNKNKQGRTTEQHPSACQIEETIRQHSLHSFALYQQLLDTGIARELARSILPVNTYTHYFGTVNLRNLFSFLSLRLDSHAQYEIRVYAQAMLELIKQIVPCAVEAYEQNANQTK